MKTLTLTQGQIAKVCDCHAHLVEGYKWCASWDKGTRSYYAIRGASHLEKLSGTPRSIRMHSTINATPRGFHTDHINGDTLDNQCSNLRTATASQNLMNRGKNSNNTSGYKGVTYNKNSRKWEAQIKINRQNKHLGLFTDPESAARAYAVASKTYYGDFTKELHETDTQAIEGGA